MGFLKKVTLFRGTFLIVDKNENLKMSPRE